DLFAAFTAQVKKDFDYCGLNSSFTEGLKADYEHMQLILANELSAINKRRPDKISELLYRIDISELQLKKKSLQRPEAAFEAIVADLIIRRELQKVVIRKFGI
ncbi:MAG: hypothetical protein ACXVP0_12560, partial [Bacteroidia bacterium]